MTTWAYDGATVTCRRAEVGKREAGADEAAEQTMQSNYLSPLPDFAAHSPFGGATWFIPRLNPPFRTK